MKLAELFAQLRSLLHPGRIRDHIAQLRVVRQELGFEAGFHGDRYILSIADFFLTRASFFVETGTLAGTTAHYVGKRYPATSVYSCEPDPVACRLAQQRCEGFANIKIVNERSPDFLHDLFDRVPDLATEPAVFWLDAHGYGFRWPLLQEIELITSRRSAGVIMIDDFKIPGRPEFGFDAYDGQECSLEFVLPALNPEHDYTLILPAYAERTSAHHGLRGVGIIVYGLGSLDLPESIGANFSRSAIRREPAERGEAQASL